MLISTSKQTKSTIFLVDMQSFYTSVEKVNNPSLRDQPLVVAGDPERRSGIVLAACPIAKKWGVQTAETLWEAEKKCPHLIVVRPHMQTYLDVSLHITSTLERFSDLAEPYSIDEQFLDVTHTLNLFGSAHETAQLVQKEIMTETGIYARIGIGPNKVLAKMACDHFAKKNKQGIFALEHAQIEATLWPLPIGKLFGVGSRMHQHFERMGIRTIGQLAQYPLPLLQKKWGINGEVLWRTANGIDQSAVTLGTHDTQKAIGHQMTLPRDYRTKEDISVVILDISELVCQRCRAKGYMGWVVSLGCQGADFDRPTGFYRQMKIPDPTNLAEDVYKAALILFNKHWDNQPVRKIGVTLSELVSDEEYQLVLFEDREKKLQLARSIDNIKLRYGNTSIMRAVSITDAGQAKDRSSKIGGHYK